MKMLAMAAALMLAALMVAGAAGPPEKDLVEDAAKALGGRDRILAIKTLTIEGQGESGALTQSLGADGKMSLSSVLGFKEIIDVPQRRMGVEYSTKRQFLFVLPEPGPVHTVVD